MDLGLTRVSNSFFDGRHGVGINLRCEVPKAFCALQVAPDLYYALKVLFFRAADDGAVLQGFILRALRWALLEETVVERKRHLDNYHHGERYCARHRILTEKHGFKRAVGITKL